MSEKQQRVMMEQRSWVWEGLEVEIVSYKVSLTVVWTPYPSWFLCKELAAHSMRYKKSQKYTH